MFPDVKTADKNGLLAISKELNTDMLIQAYSKGIFPWPMNDDDIIPWFSPPHRAVLFLDNFTIPKSLAKKIKKKSYSFSINKNFSEVIRNCAKSPNRKDATWITEKMIAAYLKLHERGYAHSIECYEDKTLVGGLYGVSINMMFAGESMFHLKSNASKLSLCYLVEHLRERKVSWIDCQQLTPLFSKFGAIEIEREQFTMILKDSVNTQIKLF